MFIIVGAINYGICAKENMINGIGMSYVVFYDGFFMFFSAVGWSNIATSLSKDGCNLNDIIIAFVPFDVYLLAYITLMLCSIYNAYYNQDASGIQGLFAIWIIIMFKNFILSIISVTVIIIRVYNIFK